jgi:hypothetical protein
MPTAKDGDMRGEARQAPSRNATAAMHAATGRSTGQEARRQGWRSSNTDQGIAKPAAPRKCLR